MRKYLLIIMSLTLLGQRAEADFHQRSEIVAGCAAYTAVAHNNLAVWLPSGLTHILDSSELPGALARTTMD